MMQTNWSFILNALLLVVVVIIIVRMLRDKRVSREQSTSNQPSVGLGAATTCEDDIIAVRRIHSNDKNDEADKISPILESNDNGFDRLENNREDVSQKSEPIMLFLLAKENRQFAGYELLQTLLAAGLRFGEGHLFHRHQYANGQGPILCSLAAATNTGVFDLQNIGAFSVRGLCLFMQTSNNPAIDKERLSIMLDTAKLLCDGLDASLLDDRQRPLSEQRLDQYYEQLTFNKSQT